MGFGEEGERVWNGILTAFPPVAGAVAFAAPVASTAYVVN